MKQDKSLDFLYEVILSSAIDIQIFNFSVFSASVPIPGRVLHPHDKCCVELKGKVFALQTLCRQTTCKHCELLILERWIEVMASLQN